MGDAWIGVDLDGVLAEYHGFKTDVDIGAPIPAMMNRVKMWIRRGKLVKVFSARASSPPAVKAIKNWLVRNGLPPLDVTDRKDHDMIELYDDRARRVETNTGRLLD